MKKIKIQPFKTLDFFSSKC